MNTWKNHISYFWMNLWHYLNQPIFSKAKSTPPNPFEPSHIDTTQFLERCWEVDCTSETQS